MKCPIPGLLATAKAIVSESAAHFAESHEGPHGEILQWTMDNSQHHGPRFSFSPTLLPVIQTQPPKQDPKWFDYRLGTFLAYLGSGVYRWGPVLGSIRLMSSKKKTIVRPCSQEVWDGLIVTWGLLHSAYLATALNHSLYKGLLYVHLLFAWTILHTAGSSSESPEEAQRA